MLNYQRVGILPYSGSPHFLGAVNVGISTSNRMCMWVCLKIGCPIPLIHHDFSSWNGHLEVSNPLGVPQIIQSLDHDLVLKPMVTTGDPPWLKKPPLLSIFPTGKSLRNGDVFWPQWCDFFVVSMSSMEGLLRRGADTSSSRATSRC
jgi:hypothetical protein